LGTPDGAVCVYCRKLPLDPAWRPFCSERCKMADLGRWLGEEYRAPVEDQDTGTELDDDGHER
jgi:endogenous inhibitor of DNA gyrase (YacG/DUF329 family)